MNTNYKLFVIKQISRMPIKQRTHTHIYTHTHLATYRMQDERDAPLSLSIRARVVSDGHLGETARVAQYGHHPTQGAVVVRGEYVTIVHHPRHLDAALVAQTRRGCNG